VAGEAPASELTRFLQDLSQRHNLSQPAIAELLRKEVAERERNESHAKQPSLPDIAPEKWSARDLNRREAPPQFIERVYGPWLDGQLTRQGLKKLDSDLYRALSVWLSRHPDDTIAALLPRKRDILDEVLDRLSGEFSLEDLRKLGYAVDARLKRDAGTKKS
jgi:transcriptional regulator with XRE-family HTH domain